MKTSPSSSRAPRQRLHRKLRLIEGPQGPRVTLDGRPVLLLCSNNYLGLAEHPTVRAAAAEAALRWGAGAGASRLISGNMAPHRRARAAAGRVQGLRRRAALRLRLPRQHRRRSPRSPPRGTVVFSDELNHASIIDGCRLARAETFVYRHRDVEHLAWGLREAGGRGSLIVTDGVFSMDGDVAPLAELAELARDHGCRLMVDEAHATGALGPGGRGSVAAAGLSGEVDVVVGTLGKALGSYGAYACAEPGAGRVPAQQRPPVHLLDRAAAADGRRGAGGARAARGGPGPGRAAARQRRRPARGAGRRGPRAGRLGDPDRPGRGRRRGGGRWSSASGCSRPASSPRGSARRPCPPGSSRLRFTVMATHAEEELRRAAAPGRRGGPGARGRARRSRPAVARRRLRRRGRGLRHRHRHRGRQDRRRRGDRPLACRRRQVGRRLQARGHRARRARRGRPRAAAPRRRLGPDATRRSPPTATARPPRRTWRPRWPASGSSATVLLAAARAAAAGAEMLVCEGVGGFLVPLSPDYLVRDLAVDLGLPLVIAAAPGLGTINHTLLTIEAARAAGLRGRGRRPHPVAATRRARSRSPTARRSPSWASVRVETLPRLDLADPSGWPRPGRA